MQKIKVNYLYDNTVAQVILDDGKGNILDSVMMADIMAAIADFAGMNRLKLITFEGAGKHFSFGASVEEHQKEQAGQMISSFHKMFLALRDLAVPTLAKITGQCLGGGMELAIMCNFLYADKTAKLGQPEIVLGVFPPPASVILPEKIGLARAEDIILTGRTFLAEEGKQMGLINELFDDRAGLEAGITTFIETYIVPKSASSLRYAVRSSRAAFNKNLGTFLAELEQLYVHDLMQSHDANEGINSFLEKRKPVWQNK
jgi:cyclohexa-1,5-dienecarbonyl-CoA hydratase